MTTEMLREKLPRQNYRTSYKNEIKNYRAIQNYLQQWLLNFMFYEPLVIIIKFHCSFDLGGNKKLVLEEEIFVITANLFAQGVEISSAQRGRVVVLHNFYCLFKYYFETLWNHLYLKLFPMNDTVCYSR
jgi:hypothetical protein